MYIERFSIRNFLSVSKVDVDIADQGLILIEGENQDAKESASSNASGKTSIFTEALTWCLFGQTTKGLKADAVLSAFNPKDCVVKAELEIKGFKLTVERYRKHKKYKNNLRIIKDGKDISRTTLADSDKLLQSILGIDYQTFLYTTILGQGLLYRFSNLTDAGRKKILESITHIDLYEEAKVVARKKATEIEKEILAKESEEKYLKDSIESLKKAKSDHEELLKKFKFEIKERKSKLNKDIAYKNKEIEKTQRDIEKSAKIGIELKKKLANKKPELESINSKFEAINKLKIEKESELKSLNSLFVKKSKMSVGECLTCGQEVSSEYKEIVLEAINHDIEEVKFKLAEIDPKWETVKKYNIAIKEEVEEIERNLNQIKFTFKRSKEQLESLERDKLNLENELSNLGNRTYKQKDFDTSSIETKLKFLDQIGSEIESLEKSKSDYKYWETGFEFIRSQVIDKTLVFLNQRLEEYSNILTDGDITVKLVFNDKNKIDLNISTKGGSYISASGGEKDRIDLAIAFALHDLATSVSDFKSNILVLDEPAVFVDQKGVNKIMQLVTDKISRVDTIVLISHNPVFTGYCDKVWKVIKKDGKSILEIET